MVVWLRLKTRCGWVLILALSTGACSSFFVPDSHLELCDTTQDCASPDDNRFVAACVYGEGQSENASKVCVAEFDDLSCQPLDHSEDRPFAVSYDAAIDDASTAVYATACADLKMMYNIDNYVGWMWNRWLDHGYGRLAFE